MFQFLPSLSCLNFCPLCLVSIFPSLSCLNFSLFVLSFISLLYHSILFSLFHSLAIPLFASSLSPLCLVPFPTLPRALTTPVSQGTLPWNKMLNIVAKGKLLPIWVILSPLCLLVCDTFYKFNIYYYGFYINAFRQTLSNVARVMQSLPLLSNGSFASDVFRAASACLFLSNPLPGCLRFLVSCWCDLTALTRCRDLHLLTPLRAAKCPMHRCQMFAAAKMPNHSIALRMCQISAGNCTVIFK